MKLYVFRTVPLSIIRSFSLYTQQWCMSYRFADSLHIPLLCVQWKTPDDGQRNWPKYIEFYSKNKFENLVHLIGFIIWIYARVNWTSNWNILIYSVAGLPSRCQPPVFRSNSCLSPHEGSYFLPWRWHRPTTIHGSTIRTDFCLWNRLVRVV
jgi:hypothetical protein